MADVEFRALDRGCQQSLIYMIMKFKFYQTQINKLLDTIRHWVLQCETGRTD